LFSSNFQVHFGAKFCHQTPLFFGSIERATKAWRSYRSSFRVMPPAIEIGTTMGGNQSLKADFPGGNVGIRGEHEVFSMIFPKMKSMFGKKNKKQNVFKNPEISPNVFPLVFPKKKK